MIESLRLGRRLALGLLAAGAALLAVDRSAAAFAPHVDVDDLVATPLERGLAAIQASNIAADLSFIASDEMGGRDTPSPELRVAARFIRSRLARLGFEPGAPEGSYFYEYPLAYAPLDMERSEARWSSPRGGGATLRLGRDYFLADAGGAAELDLAGDVVFCGFGRREDFTEAAQGKWALCLDDGKGSGRRSMTARRAGVLGLITFPAPDYAEDPYAERFASAMSSLARGRVSWPGTQRRREVFPSLFIEREHGLALLAAASSRPEGATDDWTPELGTELDLLVEEDRFLADENGTIELENVCGFWPGSHPERSKEVVLVSAHYDHVGKRGDDIFNGADDNGTGTTGLLALAEALAAHGPLERSVLLIWVSGEEKGLLGSKAWAAQPWLPDGGKPVANINIDMIGRNAPEQILYTPTSELEEYYNDLAQVLERHATAEGFTDLGSADAYYHRSDQASFETLGIPVMFLFADIHEDYHQATDTVEKIDTDKVARVTRLVLRMLVDIDDEAIER